MSQEHTQNYNWLHAPIVSKVGTFISENPKKTNSIQFHYIKNYTCLSLYLLARGIMVLVPF